MSKDIVTLYIKEFDYNPKVLNILDMIWKSVGPTSKYYTMYYKQYWECQLVKDFLGIIEYKRYEKYSSMDS